MNNNDVMLFNEEKHEYTLNGVVYTSTTQLLKKYGLSADYVGIPEAIMQKAAAKGKDVHKGLELYIGGDKSMAGLLNEVKLFQDYITQAGIDLTHAKSESMVYDIHYQVSGTIDFQYIDGNDYIIADFKNTSTLHLDAVAWQLSIYNYLQTKGDVLSYYFNKLKVYHFTRGKLYVKDVYTVDYDTVKDLLECNLNKQPVFNYTKNNNLISTSDSVVVSQILRELETYNTAVKKLNDELKVILERVKTDMVTKKDYSVKTPDFAITYVAPITRKSWNTTKIKSYLTTQGEDVEDYMNETTGADSIRIKSLIEAVDKDDDDTEDNEDTGE